MEKMLTKLLAEELKPNSRENFQILMNAKKQWEVEYAELKKYAESLIAEFNAENNCNFTFYDYNETLYKIGEYVRLNKTNTPKFFQFQNSKDHKLCQQVTSKLPQKYKKYSYITFIDLTNALNSNQPDFNFILENLKTIVKNTIISFEYKLYFLPILDTILEMTNGQLASQVIPLFSDIELNSNSTLKKFDYLYKNNGTFEEMFNLLQTYLNENKYLHPYITFFVHFNVFGKALSNKYPGYEKKCQALCNKYSDVHRFAREEYLRKNIQPQQPQQPQQNDKPPMYAGPKEPEID